MKSPTRPPVNRSALDEAYERFFDGFFNLGRPGDFFERSMVLSRPAIRPAAPPRSTRRMKRSSHRASRASSGEPNRQPGAVADKGLINDAHSRG